MKTEKSAHKYCEPYRIGDGDNFRLKDFDPGDTGKVSKEEAGELLEEGISLTTDLQQKLYAQDQWAILLIIQAMDAAGKDGLIKHVMSGVNPQGCQVTSFKEPSARELNHDFLWRAECDLPERGKIGLFNRSYYEEVLVVRVHPEILAKQHLPPSLVTKEIWKERFADIRAFERHLTRNGIVVRKFFLNVSKEEQKRRFLKRLEEPDKNWKFSESDVRERQHWDEYMDAYEDMIQHTATEYAPWYVVPADHKWFTRLAVSSAIIEALEECRPTFPQVDAKRRKELETAKKLLEGK
ncbi:MAG TPA: polyphosphate kinase 2 family protein [Verrucomicrobiae bacterium]|jgi:PPK2 family polyphosphate:nucleotide phosphotransferase|nr:polyphosphate kinase 2 family protein [Verrucomicrobiae bacterium]